MALELKRRLGSRLWPYYLKIQPFVRAVLLSIGGIWRRLLFRTTFIVISGSVGKTTAKDAIAEVLAAYFPTYKSPGSRNHFVGVFKNLVSVMPWHRFAVIEVGLDRPGQMKWFALATKPDIAVWVNVARAHMQSFKTLETVAKEKSMLVEGLRTGGLAVLYSDNPYIAEYQPPVSVRTARYGEGEGLEWRASDLSGRWPEHFSFQVKSGNEQGRVVTKLIGTHWLPSVMPALVVASEAGLTLAQAIAPLANLAPMQQRLSEAATPQGAVFLRDEWNGSVDSLKVALDVIEAAVAERKILVFTDVSDSRQKIRLRQRDMGIKASKIVDVAYFIGDSNGYAVKAAIEAGMDPGRVFGFYDIESAGKHLLAELRQGDLVLLRGRHADHLSRLYLMTLDEVSCWRTTCERKIHCDVCPELRPGPRPNRRLVQIS